MSNPLITFFVCAYNQEQFIREAVEGALVQTYSPLEIILSDDCSPDRTFEIMQEMAAAYRGPHRIVLNRNQKNLGLGAHAYRIFELSRGELLVGAAGDDVSFKDRTARIYDAWVGSSHRAFSIYSNMTVIDSSGAQQGLWNGGVPIHTDSVAAAIARCSAGVYGFSQAFHRKVFEVFGPMDDRACREDEILPFRSLILGTIVFIAEPLGCYRRHGTNMWQSTLTPPLNERRQMLRLDRAHLVTWLRDLRKAGVLGILGDEESEKLQSEVIEHLREKSIERQFYTTPLPGALLLLCRQYLGWKTFKQMLRLLKRRWQSYRKA